jgi:hypothetical protein
LEQEGNEQLTAATYIRCRDGSQFIIQFSQKRNEKASRGNCSSEFFVVFCK